MQWARSPEPPARNGIPRFSEARRESLASPAAGASCSFRSDRVSVMGGATPSCMTPCASDHMCLGCVSDAPVWGSTPVRGPTAPRGRFPLWSKSPNHDFWIVTREMAVVLCGAMHGTLGSSAAPRNKQVFLMGSLRSLSLRGTAGPTQGHPPRPSDGTAAAIPTRARLIIKSSNPPTHRPPDPKSPEDGAL